MSPASGVFVVGAQINQRARANGGDPSDSCQERADQRDRREGTLAEEEKTWRKASVLVGSWALSW